MSDILVVDDEIGIRELLSEILRDEGYSVRLAENGDQARRERARARPDLVLLDIWMPDTDGITLLKEWARGGQLTMPVVMMSGHATIDTAVESTKLGASDFLEKPIALQKLLSTVGRVLRRSEAAPMPELSLDSLGRSPVMAELKQRLAQLRATRGPLVLVAESGCRAELCAQFLHTPNTPWIEVEDARPLLNSPLDLATSANDGVLYVPSLGQLSRAEQKGLALVMGRSDRHRARVVIGTERDLADQIAAGLAEPRLLEAAPVTLQVPPLRDHREDVPELATPLLTRIIEARESPPRSFDTAALNALRNYEWPGNLLQLEQVVRSLAVTSLGTEVTAQDVARLVVQQEVPPGISLAVAPNPASGLTFDAPLREARDIFEKSYLEHHIALEGGNMSRVADKVGLERTHLYRKIKQLGIRSRRSED
ncbi:MAG: sigma-54 dependent transcriptional regulator [Proteobacteria bacterium]|nr:sigma-54 dependent transcriptional regulator [Pseudomonadota bacterium]